MRISLGLLLLVSLANLLPVQSTRAEGLTPEEVQAHEKFLEEAGITPDERGLLAFLESQTPTAENQATWSQQITELGDNDFLVREKATHALAAAGWPAVALLRQAANSDDPEVVRRAEYCIHFIERTPIADLLIAVAQVTEVRKPKGAVKALLGCLPQADDEYAIQTMLHALKTVGVTDKEASPLLVEAVRARNPLHRVASAMALARAKAEQRKLVLGLLKDPDANVRYHAAMELVQAGERKAMPALLELLLDAPLAQVYHVEDVLFQLAGESVTIDSPQQWNAAQRRTYLAAWQTWWEKQGSTVDLSNLKKDGVLLGLHLISELDGSGPKGQGRVWECGRDGKPRWELTNLQRPIDAQYLSGGNILVAEHNNKRISVRDRSGKIHWEYTAPNSPVACFRLSNGNYFIVTYYDLVEIKPSKEIVSSIRRGKMMYYAHKLRDGNIVVSQNDNQIVELDSQGKELKSISVPGTSYWSSVEKLRNGNYLVACGSANKVVEVDESGKVWWECKMDQAGHAVRLPNGRTLVTSIEKRIVAEYDRKGKQVWSQKTAGRPFHAYRR